MAEADEMGGFSLWVDEHGLLHHSYSMMGVEHFTQLSTQPIPTGDVTCACSSTPTGRSARPAAPSPSTQTRRRSAKDESRRPSSSASPVTAAWTSAATTDLSSTAPTKRRRRTLFAS